MGLRDATDCVAGHAAQCEVTTYSLIDPGPIPEMLRQLRASVVAMEASSEAKVLAYQAGLWQIKGEHPEFLWGGPFTVEPGPRGGGGTAFAGQGYDAPFVMFRENGDIVMGVVGTHIKPLNDGLPFVESAYNPPAPVVAGP